MSAGIAASVTGVVFDLDGVIIDSEHLWEQSWRSYAASRGSTWTHDDTIAVQGMSSPEWSAYLAVLVGDPDAASEVADFCVGYLIDQMAVGEGDMIDGARELLESVSARVRIALASSAPRRAIDAVLARHALSDLFTATVSSEEVPRGKPSPDVYLEAVRRLGIEPSDGLAIEDSSNGIRSAHAAGLVVVAIPNPTYPPHPDAAALAQHVALDHVDARRFVLSTLATPVAVPEDEDL